MNNLAWWEPEDGPGGSKPLDPVARARALIARANAIDDTTENRTARNIALTNARMYENNLLSNLYMFSAGLAEGSRSSANAGNSWVRPTTVQPMFGDKTSINHLRAAVQTAHSMIASNRIRPRFLASGGDWQTHRKCAALTKVCDGVFAENDTHALGGQCFIDASVLKLGAIQTFHDGRRVRHQRIIPTELNVDPAEAVFGWSYVRTVGRRRRMDRGAVLQQFGKTEEAKKAILNVPKHLGFGVDDNTILVDEAWHKSTIPGGTDGYHSICIPDFELAGGPWPFDWVPISILVWEDSLLGVWGTSIAEQCSLAQLKITKLTERIDASVSMASVPRLVQTGTPGTPTTTITNKVGLVVKELTPNSIRPLDWKPNIEPAQAEREFQIQQLYATIGISQQQAQALTSLGADASGEALRIEIQKENKRLSIPQQKWDAFFVDIAKNTAMVARELWKSMKGQKRLSFAIPGRRYATSVDWQDVGDLEVTDYVVDCQPTAAMPNDPAGRILYAERLVKAGIWTPARGAQAIHELDVEAPETLQEASRKHLEKAFDTMLAKGSYEPPDELDDLVVGVPLAGEFALRAMNENYPEEHVNQLRKWITEAATMLKKQVAPPAPTPGNQVAAAPLPTTGGAEVTSLAPVGAQAAA